MTAALLRTVPAALLRNGHLNKRLPVLVNIVDVFVFGPVI